MKSRRTNRIHVKGFRGGLPANVVPEWVNPADGSAAPRVDRKALQLCAQVAETLEQVFAEQEDDALRDLHVESVDPAPDSSHLLVTVRPLAQQADPIAIMGRLNEASVDLRLEMAGAITRRRVPALTFRVVPPTGLGRY